MKLTVPVVPIGVVAVTVRAPVAAVVVKVQFAFTVVAVGVPVTLQVMPEPEKVTAVAPVKLVPVSTTACGFVAVREPDVGLIEASVGPITVKATAFVVPAGAVTVTL